MTVIIGLPVPLALTSGKSYVSDTGKRYFALSLVIIVQQYSKPIIQTALGILIIGFADHHHCTLPPGTIHLLHSFFINIFIMILIVLFGLFFIGPLIVFAAKGNFEKNIN